MSVTYIYHQVPGNLKNSKNNEIVISTLLENKSIKRLAGHANSKSNYKVCPIILTPAGVFRTWAPKLHDYYKERLGKLHAKTPGLWSNFGDSTVWPAATFNLGPQTMTYEHRDSANLAFGWCAVTAARTDYAAEAQSSAARLYSAGQ